MKEEFVKRLFEGKELLSGVRGLFEQGANSTALMNDMERIFKIPCFNDPQFNEQNADVINLYREISNSRSM